MRKSNNNIVQNANNPRIKRRLYLKFFKRPMDFALSTLAILILSPIMLVLVFLIRINLGSPVLFKQKRPGLNEKIFTMYKFRTMTDEKDENGHLLPDDIRLTKFGKILRATSLDELPELFNIVKGDMSIVGPRPLLIQYLSLYDNNQRRRHDVRPGLTGKAQINGRNSISWEHKFDLDIEYIDSVSFIEDCKTIFMTIKKVVLRDGISSNTSSTMEVFQGSDKKNGE